MLSGGVIGAGRRQVPDLLPGDAEPDAVAEPGHHLGRDVDVLVPPHVPLPDQHVGHPAAARVDQSARPDAAPGLASLSSV